MSKTTRNIVLFLGAIIILFLVGYLYSAFFRPVHDGNTGNFWGFLLTGLILGALIASLVLKLLQKTYPSGKIVENSHTVVESMRRVFKVVCAEGEFHEIYDYENTKKLFKILPLTKKALVIVTARVMVGFDFEKCEWKIDPATHRITVVSFPQPEILSLEPEFKYYYFEEDLFHLIGREDLLRIQEEGKKQVRIAALNSGLTKIAIDQMRTMLTEVLQANQWQIDNPDMIKILPAAQSDYGEK